MSGLAQLGEIAKSQYSNRTGRVMVVTDPSTGRKRYMRSVQNDAGDIKWQIAKALPSYLRQYEGLERDDPKLEALKRTNPIAYQRVDRHNMGRAGAAGRANMEAVGRGETGKQNETFSRVKRTYEGGKKRAAIARNWLEGSTTHPVSGERVPNIDLPGTGAEAHTARMRRQLTQATKQAKNAHSGWVFSAMQRDARKWRMAREVGPRAKHAERALYGMASRANPARFSTAPGGIDNLRRRAALMSGTDDFQEMAAKQALARSERRRRVRAANPRPAAQRPRFDPKQFRYISPQAAKQAAAKTVPLQAPPVVATGAPARPTAANAVRSAAKKAPFWSTPKFAVGAGAAGLAAIGGGAWYANRQPRKWR